MFDKMITFEDLIEINNYLYEIPQSFREDMKVPARIYMTKDMFEDIKEDRSLVQLVNTATLPGIIQYAIAMPDIHQGYGFPIGGVVATDINKGGVISPGGIGYDINCGVRLLVAHQRYQEIKAHMETLADELFRAVPSGVGVGAKLKFDATGLDRILQDGAHAMVELGYGNQEDLEYCEEKGRMSIAQPSLVSAKAKERGRDQLGTLGSGNHFLEIQQVVEIYDEKAAKAFGIEKDMVTIMIHCGSRGLGHQVCTDYVRIMMDNIGKYGYTLPDRELVCVPFNSSEGQDYFAAMSAAANFAWANRHTIGHWVREVWHKVLGSDATVKTMYDVSHNIGKREQHVMGNKTYDVLMHRKGATRAFGPGRPEIPYAYRTVGQPVLIPGTMGTASYILTGTEESMQQAFGTSCHGAGRRMSRARAKKEVWGSQLRHELEQQGIIIRCESNVGLAEEAPLAYKDVDSVVNVVHNAKLALKVAKLVPRAVIKGG